MKTREEALYFLWVINVLPVGISRYLQRLHYSYNFGQKEHSESLTVRENWTISLITTVPVGGLTHTRFWRICMHGVGQVQFSTLMSSIPQMIMSIEIIKTIWLCNFFLYYVFELTLWYDSIRHIWCNGGLVSLNLYLKYKNITEKHVTTRKTLNWSNYKLS